MQEKKWFQKELFRILVDMHIPDWDERFLRDFSPERYADMMALAGVDTAEIYASSCLGLCYWPTRVGFQHRQLNGRDLLGETIAACRERGIAVQIYTNVWNRAAYDAHPEWRIVLADGTHVCDAPGFRFGQCCHNSPYRDFVSAVLAELNENYDCRGFWIDMCGLYRHCYCPACQARFQAETGYAEIPRTVDWNDPVWLAYEQARKRWLGEFIQRLRKTVTDTHPERTVTFQSAPLTFGRDSGIGDEFLQAGDYLAGDFTGDRIEQSCICKSFSLLSKNRPIEFMTPRCEDLAHHTTERSMDNLRMRAYAAIANQASFTLIDAIDPAGTMDRRFYEHAREIGRIYRQYAQYIDGDSKPCFDIGLYESPDSLFCGDRPLMPVAEFDLKTPLDFNKPRRNLTSMFQKKHRLFAFVHARNGDDLDGIPLIVLSNCSILSDAECSRLREYVRRGGRLYASYMTSLADPDKGLLKDFRLADLFGVHYAGRKTHRVTYIAPAKDGIPGTTAQYPLMLNGPQLEINADPGTEILGTRVMPVSAPEETVYFGSAISNPPLVPTGKPALVRRRYGKGEVLYIAGNLEEVGYDFHQRILDSLLMDLMGNPPQLETNAPSCVECTLFDRANRQELLFSCLNLPLELPPLPLYDLTFTLRLKNGLKVQSVQFGPEETPHVFTQQENLLHFSLEKMQDFAFFIIRYIKN